MKNLDADHSDQQISASFICVFPRGVVHFYGLGMFGNLGMSDWSQSFMNRCCETNGHVAIVTQNMPKHFRALHVLNRSKLPVTSCRHFLKETFALALHPSERNAETAGQPWERLESRGITGWKLIVTKVIWKPCTVQIYQPEHGVSMGFLNVT